MTFLMRSGARSPHRHDRSCQTILVQDLGGGMLASPLGAMESLATLGVRAGLPRELGRALEELGWNVQRPNWDGRCTMKMRWSWERCSSSNFFMECDLHSFLLSWSFFISEDTRNSHPSTRYFCRCMGLGNFYEPQEGHCPQGPTQLGLQG